MLGNGEYMREEALTVKKDGKWECVNRILVLF